MAFRKQMRLCFITPYYYPIKGGISTNILNLAVTLQKYKNIDVIIFTRKGKSNKIVRAIDTTKIIFVIRAFFALYKEKPDVIHTQSEWYTLMPGVLYKLLCPKTRLIHTFRTEPVGEERNRLKRVAFEWLLNKCDTITFVSKKLKEKCIETWNLNIKTETKVIYGGVSRKSVKKEDVEAFKKRYSLKDNQLVVSFIGLLVWEMKVEGVKRLIKAFKIVVARYSDARLLIVGDGTYKKELAILARKLDISNNVIFTGFLDDVFTSLEVTDIYAHISLQEGFPISILEAMSMKKPVIAIPVGGIPEIVTNNKTGILVEPQPQSIANTIIELYGNDRKKKELGENAYIKVERDHTWDKIANEFIEIYQAD